MIEICIYAETGGVSAYFASVNDSINAYNALMTHGTKQFDDLIRPGTALGFDFVGEKIPFRLLYVSGGPFRDSLEVLSTNGAWAHFGQFGKVDEIFVIPRRWFCRCLGPA